MLVVIHFCVVAYNTDAVAKRAGLGGAWVTEITLAGACGILRAARHRQIASIDGVLSS